MKKTQHILVIGFEEFRDSLFAIINHQECKAQETYFIISRVEKKANARYDFEESKEKVNFASGISGRCADKC